MSSEQREPPPSPEEEDRDRRTTNIFLAVAALILVVTGVWLANALVDARRADDCLSAGRRNCAPIDVPPR